MKAKIIAALFLAVALMAGFVSAQPAAHGRKLTIEDYYRIKTVGDPQISPNGKWVAFTVATKIEEDNTTAVETYLVPADGSAAPRKIQHDGKDVAAPHWTDDNMLQYSLKSRTNSAIFFPGEATPSEDNQGQLWKISIDSPSAVPVKA